MVVVAEGVKIFAVVAEQENFLRERSQFVQVKIRHENFVAQMIFFWRKAMVHHVAFVKAGIKVVVGIFHAQIFSPVSVRQSSSADVNASS